MSSELKYCCYFLFGTMILLALAIIWRMTVSPTELAAAQAVRLAALGSFLSQLQSVTVSFCASLIGLVGPIVAIIVLWRKHNEQRQESR